jgi:hypothetical protein
MNLKKSCSAAIFIKLKQIFTRKTPARTQQNTAKKKAKFCFKNLSQIFIIFEEQLPQK